MVKNEKFMLKALALAKKGEGCVSPNPLVGAVLVRDGKIIARGWHKKYGDKHAEVNAILAAGKNARGSELYVTLEPCNHYGKQPPCTKAIIKAGISRVYAAMKDPDKRSCNGACELAKHKIPVEFCLCGKTAEKQNEIFVKNVRKKNPFIALKMAMTLDGFITWGNGKNKKVTGKEAFDFSQTLRKKYDGILAGVNTILKDNPNLTYRKDAYLNPVRIVLDPHAKTPTNANILKWIGETIIVCTKKANPEKVWKLMISGAQIITAKQRGGKIDLKWLMRELFGMGINSILVEGGAATNTEFVQQELYDKVYMLIAPKKVHKGLRALRPLAKIKGNIEDAKKLGKDTLVIIGK